ncbi:MAG: DUF1992 domain-containing protein [Chloroflexi bacterium]|nr:MAG: DUF1992 domain-containing protein [Chloroflexota bacterium]
MNDFESPLDKIIREAREKGAFDDLPGKGKPIQWDDDEQAPEEQRLANRLLKNNGFTLDWIELGQELDRQHEGIRARLEQTRELRAAGRLDEQGWKEALKRAAAGIRELNKRIIGYNLRVPSESFQRRPYPLDSELKELGD